MDKDSVISLFKALGFQVILFGLLFFCTEIAFRLYSKSLFTAPPHLQNKNYQNTNQLMVPNVIPYAGFTLYHDLDVTLLNKKLTSNGLGYRTPNFSQKKDNNTLRILGIGDSVMMGQGVSDDEVYLRVLENKLKECTDKPLEVINLGIAGQSAEQEFYLLREMIKLKPDIVIFGYVGNDWVNEEKSQTRNYFSSSSYALNFIILHTLKMLGKLNDKYGHPINPVEWRPFKRLKRPGPIGLSRAYQEMSFLLKSINARGYVVMDSRYEALEKSHEEMEGFFRRMNMEPLNLLKMWHPLPPMLPGTEAVSRQDEHNQKYVIPGDYHPNALWHRDVAEVLFEKLKKELCQ